MPRPKKSVVEKAAVDRSKQITEAINQVVNTRLAATDAEQVLLSLISGGEVKAAYTQRNKPGPKPGTKKSKLHSKANGQAEAAA